MRKGKKIDWFAIINYIILITAGLLCLIPLIHILALSFSSSSVAAAGRVMHISTPPNAETGSEAKAHS